MGVCSENVNEINPITSELELVSINEVSPSDLSNGRVQVDGIEFMNLKIRLNDDWFQGIAVLLESSPDKSKIGLLGIENKLVAYVNVINIAENHFTAEYYTADNQLYMETSMKDNILTFDNFYNINTSMSNGRSYGWFDDFAQCVEDVALEVASDPALSAAAVVGGYCCAGYVLTGLGIGCAINASL